MQRASHAGIGVQFGATAATGHNMQGAPLASSHVWYTTGDVAQHGAPPQYCVREECRSHGRLGVYAVPSQVVVQPPPPSALICAGNVACLCFV